MPPLCSTHANCPHRHTAVSQTVCSQLYSSKRLATFALFMDTLITFVCVMFEKGTDFPGIIYYMFCILSHAHITDVEGAHKKYSFFISVHLNPLQWPDLKINL